ncbi:TonB-dependent siderophore receptor [Reyranella sp.]|uniref:TonB-dependent siderophore receptor n=1 Tax=Reyranella sp. TaxID=1929291 RepID=UPI003BA8F0CB
MISIDRTERRRVRARAAAGQACGLAVAAIVAASALAAPAAAQDDRPTIPPRLEAQRDRTASFDLPAQPLPQALTAFGRQSGLQVAFDPAAAAGKTSVAVSGTMTPERALRQLLGASGLFYQFTSARAVTVSAVAAPTGAIQLDPVQVQGAFPVPAQAMIDNLPPPYAGGQVATGGQLGLLGNRDVMDTPFNQTSYTAKKAQNQQAQSVKDVLIDDPSVRGVWASGNGTRDDLTIRGFRVNSGDYTFGGLYGILPRVTVPAELPERVEVLKGPSAMLNGMAPNGSIGGTVNLVPKRAPDEPLTQLTASYASAAQFGAHADVGRRFGQDKQFGVRFNGVYRGGQTAISGNTDELALASLGVDFRGERVRLSGDFGYQYQKVGWLVAMPIVAAGVPIPGVPTLSNNFGQPWGYYQRADVFGAVRGEIDLFENVTAYAAYGTIDSRNTYLTGGFPTIVNVNGSTTQRPNVENDYYDAWTGEVGVRALVDTGPIDHELAVSATTYQQAQGYGFVNGTAFASSIYTPTFVPRPNLGDPPARKSSTGTLSSIAFADTLSAAAKRIQLTVGGRFQGIDAANYNVTSGVQTSNYSQSAFSPSAALVFKPWSNVSIYGNFIQGLQQGTIVGTAFANAGQILPPYKSTQFEVGVKVDWGKFGTTANIFQITQPSTITNTATNTLSANGEQRNQGLELNLFGEPAEGVRLLGGIMLINAVLAKTAGGLTDGWRAPGVPGVQLNLGGEWDTPFARGLTLNGRVIYTGVQYVDTTWPRRTIPDWARLDVGARYTLESATSPTGQPLIFRFNIDNLLDTNYWATVTNSYLVQGTPRTFRLSLTADF